MNTTARLLVVSATFLLGASFVPAAALDLNVGGVSIGGGSTGNGGTTLSVGTGGSVASATLGGGSNVAAAGIGTGGGTGGVNLGVGGTSGPLITTNNDGGNTNANVNLGLAGLGLGDADGALNGVTGPVGEVLDGASLPDLSGIGGIGGGNGNGAGAAARVQLASNFNALSGGDQQELRLRCRSILTSPAAFDQSLVTLCRMIAKIDQ